MRRPVKLYRNKKGFYLLSKSGKEVYLDSDLNFKQLQTDIIKFYKQSKTKIKKKKYKKRLYRKKAITQKELTEEQRRNDTSSSSSSNTIRLIQQPAPIGQKDILYMTDTEKQEPYLLKIKQLEQLLLKNTDNAGNIDRDFKNNITRAITDLSDKSKIGESVIKSMINKSYNEDMKRQTETADKKLNVRSGILGRKIIPPLKTYDLDEWAKLSGSRRQYLNMKWKKEKKRGTDGVERPTEPPNADEVEDQPNATYDMLREQQKRRVNDETGEERLRQRLENEINMDIEEEYMATEELIGKGVYEDENKYIINEEHDLSELSFLRVINLKHIKNINILKKEPTYFIIRKDGNYTAVFIDDYDCCIYDPLGENDTEIKKEVLELCLDTEHTFLRKIKYNTKRNKLCFDTGFCCIMFLEKMLNGESFKNATIYDERETEKYIEQYV